MKNNSKLHLSDIKLLFSLFYIYYSFDNLRLNEG